MKKRIAICGSCITRDNFNTMFNPNYKMFFECVLTQHQPSIISMMSKEIPCAEDEAISKMKDFDKWHIRTECNKEFLNLIKQKNPEYLLIDLYGDVYFGITELENNAYITNNPKFVNVSFLKGNNKKISLENEQQKYFDLWKPMADEFFAILKKEIPNCSIVLVKTRFSDEMIDGSSLTEIRKKANKRIIDVDYMNSLWDKLDNYIIDNFNVSTINMTEKRYKLKLNHPWGAFYVHYTMDYYNDFFNKLQYIVFEDLYKQLSNKRTKELCTAFKEIVKKQLRKFKKKKT